METSNTPLNTVFFDAQFHVVSYLSHPAALQNHLEILSGVFKNNMSVSIRNVTQFIVNCNDEKTLYFGVRLVDHWIAEYEARLASEEQGYANLVSRIAEFQRLARETSSIVNACENSTCCAPAEKVNTPVA